MSGKVKSIHPLSVTALGEPWPPQQPVSTVSIALCSSEKSSITPKSSSNFRAQKRTACSLCADDLLKP